MTYRTQVERQYKQIPYRGSTLCTAPPSLSSPLEYSKIVDNVHSDNSPRVNGKLVLRPNGLTRTYIRLNGGPALLSKTARNPADPKYACAVERGISLFSYQSIVPTLVHSSVDYAAYESVNDFYSNLGNMKFNAAQSYAERNQTLRMIGERTRKLAYYFRQLRRGRNPFRGNRRSNREDAGSLWLEYTYGWVPLVSDIYGACEFASGEPPRMKTTGKGSERYLDERVGTRNLWSPLVWDWSEQFVGNATVKTVATVTVSDPSLAFTASTGLLNPVLLGWELLPYSFVVDWFIPIGNWLESMTATLGISLQYGSQTKTVKGEYSLTGPIRSSHPNTIAGASNLSLKGSYRLKGRTIGVPPRALPRVRNPLSWSHAASGIALLRQAFR